MMHHGIEAARYDKAHFLFVWKQTERQVNDKRRRLRQMECRLEIIRKDVQQLNNDCCRYRDDTAQFRVELEQAETRLRDNELELRSLAYYMGPLKIEIKRLNNDCGRYHTDYIRANVNLQAFFR